MKFMQLMKTITIKTMPLNSFIKHPSVLIFTIDIQPNVRFDYRNGIVCNDALIQHSGYSEDEIINMKFLFVEKLMHPDDYKHYLRNVEYLLKNQFHSHKAIYRIKAKNKRRYSTVFFCSIIQHNKNNTASYNIINMAIPCEDETLISTINNKLGKSLFSSLSKRERDVAHLITYGRTNKQISQELEISEETVKVHHKNIKRKLHAESSAHLMQILIKRQEKK